MMAETKSGTQGSESLDLRKVIETIPALVVCALPDGSADDESFMMKLALET